MNLSARWCRYRTQWHHAVVATAMLLLTSMTTACAQTSHIEQVDVFEARAASMTARLGWIKKTVTAEGPVIYVTPQAFLTSHDLASAVARTDALGRALIVLSVKSTSGIKLMAATARQENTHVALLMNGDVVAVVPAKGAMTGNRMAIEGFRSEADASRFADRLNGLVR
jgi:preprotein translocase subunit SecD